MSFLPLVFTPKGLYSNNISLSTNKLFIIDPNFNGFTYSPHFAQNLPDLNKREFTILSILVAIIIVSGIYPTLF
jgi:NADH:ubiquinone oxidoreductase subunit 4 (subunit M)